MSISKSSSPPANLPPYPRPPEEDLYEAERECDYWRVKVLALNGAIARLQDDLAISTKQAKSWSRKLEAIRGKLGENSR